MCATRYRRLDHEAVMRSLRNYAQELSRHPEVHQVVLIGSLARGDWSARSDADVVIVVDEADEPGPFRSPRYAPRGRMGIPLDLLVFTTEEAKGWRPRFRTEVARGIVLHRRANGPSGRPSARSG